MIKKNFKTTKKASVGSRLSVSMINALKDGRNPFFKNWKSFLDGQLDPNSFAINAFSKRLYQGVNQIVLPAGWYVTFKQCEAMGGKVNKGAKGYTVATYSKTRKLVENPTDNPKNWDEYDAEEDKFYKNDFFIGTKTVFNVNDTTLDMSGFIIPNGNEDFEASALNSVMDYVARNEVNFEESDFNYFSNSEKCMYTVNEGEYTNTEDYYYDVFKVASYSTAHSDLLNRKDNELLERDSYPTEKEEMTSIISSCFCMGYLDIYSSNCKYNEKEFLIKLAEKLEQNTKLQDHICSIVSDANKAFKLIMNVEGDVLKQSADFED